MHSLFLTTGVDRNNTRVHNDYNTYYEIMLFQNHIRYQRDQVQRFLFRAFQLHNHHKQVGPCKHSTVGMIQILMVRKKPILTGS